MQAELSRSTTVMCYSHLHDIQSPHPQEAWKCKLVTGWRVALLGDRERVLGPGL